MSRKAKLLVVITVLLAILGVIVCGCSGANDRAKSPKKTPPLSGVVPNSNSKPEDSGYKTFSSVPEAERALGFSVKLPKKLANVAVKSVFVGDNAMNEPGLDVGYESGVGFECYKANGPVDYAGQIKSMETLSSQASVKPSLLPHVVTIAGHQGMLWPPHKNAGGPPSPGPAQVFWSDSGFKYQVTSATSEQAIAIAESVY